MYKSEATCLICSKSWGVHEARENKHIYCKSCRSHESAIDYGHDDPCLPWRGEFDNDDNPMRKGQLYMAGPRTCGHKDCVQESHIKTTPEAWQILEAERLDKSYLNGRKLSWDRLMEEIGIELPKMSEVPAKLSARL